MIVEVTTVPAPVIQIITESNYEVLVTTPPPVVVEVKGLFASTFVDSEQTTDLLLNYQIAKL
jgi:hypothetical protein